MVSYSLRVLENSLLCSPMVEVGLFYARIDGECEGREIVTFGLYE